MSNIDKQALRKLLDRVIANSGMTWYSEEQLGSEDCFDFPEVDAGLIAALGPKDVLALLDELEAAEERYVDMLRQARSFREAHDSASEIIRKLERNKPTVKLPTTRLWAGKIACYEESEVVAMLEIAGINIAAAGKGE